MAKYNLSDFVLGTPLSPISIRQIDETLGKSLNERYSLVFRAPKYKIQYVTQPKPHPLGGSMENWSEFAKPENMDYVDIAERIIIQGIPLPKIDKLTMHPDIPGMTMFLNPLNYRDFPYIKPHEYKHITTRAIPHNLAYIYGQKLYNRMKSNGHFLKGVDIDSMLMLARGIEKWLNSNANRVILPAGPLRFNWKEKRIERMRRLMDSIDKKLDDYEQQDNLYYRSLPLYDDWNRFYDEFLLDMDEKTMPNQ
jgi:hypothetical protein